MEGETSEVGKRREASGRNVEDSWGMGLGRRQAEKWGKNRRQGWGKRSGETRRRGETEKEADWGAHRVPEVRGTRVSLWSQPSSSVFVPCGFKEQEAGADGKSWGAWSIVSTLPHLPGPPPTRLSRIQSGVEPLSSPNLGVHGLHSEAGEQACGAGEPSFRHSWSSSFELHFPGAPG